MRLFLLLLIIATVVFAYPIQNSGSYEDDNDEAEPIDEEDKMMKDEATKIDEREGPYVDFRDGCEPRLSVGGCKCTTTDEYGSESIVEYDDDDDCRQNGSS